MAKDDTKRKMATARAREIEFFNLKERPPVRFHVWLRKNFGRTVGERHGQFKTNEVPRGAKR